MKHFGNSLSYEEIINDLKHAQQAEKSICRDRIKKIYKATTSRGEFTIHQEIRHNGGCYSWAEFDGSTIAESHQGELSSLRWLKSEVKCYGLWDERVCWRQIK